MGMVNICGKFNMLKLLSILVLAFSVTAHALDIIPIGSGNNKLYYKIGGGNDFALPAVSSTRTTLLETNSNLGIGYSCGAFNPALSIRNSINDLKNSVDNLEQNIITNATGSLIQLPMYLLAQANPTAYNLLNNTLISAHNKLVLSTSRARQLKIKLLKVRILIKIGELFRLTDQWKKHLTLVSSGNEDIINSKKEIDAHSGENGVPWIQGKSDSDSILHAGGKSQPPIHVISDTVKAGYNAMLNRNYKMILMLRMMNKIVN